MKKNNLLPLFIAVGIVCITFIVFSPSLKCDFTNYDDNKFILQNPLIINKSVEVKKIFQSTVMKNDYYPITIISLACNYHLGKLNPFGYHLVNVLLHLFNTLLVFVFIFYLTKRNLLMASIVALFFGIHPMHVESVTWITERKDVLFTFFFLAGLLSYLRFKQSKKMIWYVITFALFILSCLSKGTAVVFPAILLLIDYLSNEKLNKKMILEKIPLFIISLFFIILTYVLHKGGSLHAHVAEKTFMQRIMFASYDTLWYVYKLIIPNNLSAIYPYPDENAIPLIYYLSPFILLCILVSVYFFMRKEKIILFGLLFYFVSIVLMLQLIPTGGGEFNMADRYNYLPSIGLFFIFAHLVHLSWKNKTGILSTFKYPISGILVVGAVVFCFQANARTTVWLNSGTLWTDVITKYPENCFGYLNRAQYEQEQMHDDAKALADYNKSILLNPEYSEAYNNRGTLYFKLQQYDLAMSDYEKAILLNTSNSEAYNNRGTIYLKQNKLDLAIADFNRALSFNPDYTSAYFNRGNVYFKQNNYELAMQDYKQALSIDPDNAEAYSNRGMIYAQQKQFDLAIADYNKALELNSNFAEAYRERGILYDNNGQAELAMQDYNTAIALNQTFADVYNNRGVLYVKQEKYDLAMNDYNACLKIDSSYAPAYYNRAIVFVKQKEDNLAMVDYTRAIALDTNYADAYNNRGILFGKQGKLILALADFTKATEISPSNDNFRMNRSKTENILNRK